MKQLTMLVTAAGRWVLPDSEEFLSELGDANPDYDAPGFAVRNLGFIKFLVLDHLVTEIELHPRNVDLRALAAVQAQLGKTGTNLFRIKYLDSEWRSEISPSAEHTATRLRELCAATASVVDPFSTERFQVEAQDCNTLMRDAENPLRLFAMKWRTSFGEFDPNLISFAIDNEMLASMVIVGVKVRPQAMDPVFRYIGTGHATWLDRDQHFRIIGQSLQNLPDKDYGAWLSEFYKNVAQTGQPRYDRVTASIQRQPSAYRTRYERLLLPWKTGTDEVLVTVCNRRLGSDGAPISSRSAPDSSLSKNEAKSS